MQPFQIKTTGAHCGIDFGYQLLTVIIWIAIDPSEYSFIYDCTP